MRFLRSTKSKSIRIILIAMLLAGAFCFSPAFAASESGQPDAAADGRAPGEVIVVFEDNADGREASTESALEKIEEEHPVAQHEVLAESVGVDGEGVLFHVTDDVDTDEAVAELSDLPGVAFAQPNYQYQLFDDGTDPYLDRQYSLDPWDEDFSSGKDVGANVKAAWKMLGGITDPDHAEVTIAVLDTGCQMTHEDLRGNVLADLAYDSVTGLTGAANVKDSHGHGTHVAGIACGEAGNGKGISGSAGNYAKLLPINIFDTKGAYTSYMLQAFQYMDQLMAFGSIPKLRVINMSVGRPPGDKLNDRDYALQKTIASMRDKGVITICAGGNGDENKVATYNKFTFPGDFDECLSVTSLDQQGCNSEWSCYGDLKDISAPGENILSTAINGKDTSAPADQGYDYMKGTSMAAPLVSGIAALLWADNPELTVDQVVKSLKATAHKVNPSKNDRTGKTGSAGAVDAAAAIAYARELTGYTPDIPVIPDDPVNPADPTDPNIPVVDDPVTEIPVNTIPELNNKPKVRVIRTPARVGSTFVVGHTIYKVTKLAGKKSQVTLVKSKAKGNVKLPVSVKWKGITFRVTAIKSKAFQNCKKLKKLTISSSVKTIGKGAFKGCTKLKTLVLKTDDLKKSSVKGSLKGSKIKTVKLSLGSKKKNRRYAKKYRKYFDEANSGRKVKVSY